MPELPDIEAYLAAMRPRINGRAIRRIVVANPFLVRTFEPDIETAEGRVIEGLSRLGKRIVFTLAGDLHLVLHLMIAGRLRWNDKPDAKPPGRIGLMAVRFDDGTLQLTEAGSKRRASLHVVEGRDALAAHDPGGLEVLASDRDAFAAALRSENHTLKRTLTDPRLISGIGNAYSDEILHAAQLAPTKLTTKLTDDEIDRLFDATQRTLTHWTQVLTAQFLKRFPGAGDVTAFRDDFAVHGKYDQPCPTCGTNVQRIQYAENETNYCP